MEKIKLTDEIVAAFIDGNATADETRAVLAEIRSNPRFREYMAIAAGQEDVLPMLAKAAEGEGDSLCNIRCERFILERFGIVKTEEELSEKARTAEWLKDGGTPLFRIGSLCADYGLCVSRKYYATLDDVRIALEHGSGVIVAVDGGEIEGESILEAIEDRYIGQIPDHSLVVLSLEDEIVVYNPILGTEPQRVARDRFIDAWRDSRFYMVSVNTIEKVVETYKPAPLDLSGVTLPEELDELTEAISENTHEVWSKGRMAEGWTWGPERNDATKKHPDLLPYSALTEGEKEYDRVTAMNAIKLVLRLGYKIEKDI